MKICRSIHDLPDLAQLRGQALVVDTETSGLSPHHGDRICGIVFGPLHGSEGWYLPLRDGPMAEARRRFCDDLFRDSRLWVGHNLKFDLKMLWVDGWDLPGEIFDTMVVAAVLAGGLYEYSLDKMTAKFVPGFVHTQYQRVLEWKATQPPVNLTDKATKRQVNYSLAPVELMGAYALEDLQATRLLAQALMKLDRYEAPDNFGCAAWTTEKLLANENKLVRVLAEMEYKGVQIDVDRAARLKDQTLEEMEGLEAKLATAAGFDFHPSEWKNRDAAFVTAGGEIKYWTKKVKGKQKLDQFTTEQAQSTGRSNWNAQAQIAYLKDFLQDGNTRAFDFMYDFKQWDTRRQSVSTYLEPMLRGVDKNHRLHGQFHQHRVVTGRLSSSDPNLQNISKSGGTLDQKALEKFMGRGKDDAAVNRLLRGLFVAKPGYVLLSLDLSQIEYRTAVHYSQDARMLGLWRGNPALDYHEQTQVDTGLDRDCCKIINFGTLYGMAGRSLGLALSAMGKVTTEAEAREFLDRLFHARPALHRLIRDTAGAAKRNGWVQNAFGRVNRIPYDRSYIALNYLVQGTVGDYMRELLVRIATKIVANHWPADMLLTVHDELIFEIPRDAVSVVAPLLRAEMCACPFLSVPILSDCEVGSTWGTLETWS